jgi:hypothetical protein
MRSEVLRQINHTLKMSEISVPVARKFPEPCRIFGDGVSVGAREVRSSAVQRVYAVEVAFLASLVWLTVGLMGCERGRLFVTEGCIVEEGTGVADGSVGMIGAPVNPAQAWISKPMSGKRRNMARMRLSINGWFGYSIGLGDNFDLPT